MLVLQKRLSTIIVHDGSFVDWRAAAILAKELTTCTNSCSLINARRADDIADVMKAIAYCDNFAHSFAEYLAELLWQGFAGDDDEDIEPCTVEIDLAFRNGTEHFTVDLTIPITYHTQDCGKE